ncbi:hypothetical protein [Parabacteroides bouchesdurhonensis]|uniref:hypothetical protein n=1 Tax=Parabacteroides bouchesdurhonensis TaxID=1936995 RepID=UPI0018FEB543|nr:hypothetical protein [Parabacteroides bouchesdurhonensis]
MKTNEPKYSDGRSAAAGISSALFSKADSTTLNLNFDIIPVCCCGYSELIICLLSIPFRSLVWSVSHRAVRSMPTVLFGACHSYGVDESRYLSGNNPATYRELIPLPTGKQSR